MLFQQAQRFRQRWKVIQENRSLLAAGAPARLAGIADEITSINSGNVGGLRTGTDRHCGY